MPSEQPPSETDEAAHIAQARVELVSRLQTVTVAWSVSGRTVGFITGFDSGLEVGGFAVVATPAGVRLLVQVHDLELAERQGLQVELSDAQLGGSNGLLSGAHVDLVLRFVRGTGQVLAEVTDAGVKPSTPVGFTEAAIGPADDDLVSQLVQSGLGQAVGLPIGRSSNGAPAVVRASAFSRHTFLVGQSGSGKTYALGVILERLLVHTTLPLIVIDPNSDYVHLGKLLPRERVAPRGGPAIDADRYAELGAAMAASGPVRVARADDAEFPLRIHLSDLSLAEQALILGLDSLRDADEYSAFIDVVEPLTAQGCYGIDRVVERLQAGGDAWSQRLLQRIRNLNIAGWSIWAATSEPSLIARLGAERAVVLDTGSIDDVRERAAVALAVFGHLRRRDERQSVLLVIDEAHNLLAPTFDDPLQRAVVDHGVWVAGEGRKYGVHLLLSTQRPQKVHRNILSQCDNLVLMRVNSAADIDELASVFSHAPRPMIEEAKSFVQGEMLVAGPLATPPRRVSTAERWCPEGGADLPTEWATHGALATEPPPHGGR